MEFKVTPINNGTVIDHIEQGMALKVLKILGITGKRGSVVSVVMNVPSKMSGLKDIVKIEDREVAPEELNKIALIAPNATINFIKNSTVTRKHHVELPDILEGIVKCSNPNCISNKEKPSEPVEGRTIVDCKSPLILRCYYCDRELENILKNIR